MNKEFYLDLKMLKQRYLKNYLIFFIPFILIVIFSIFMFTNILKKSFKIGIIIFITCFLISVIKELRFYISSLFRSRKYLDSLNEQMISEIQNELKNFIISRKDCTLTENYLIIHNALDFAILKYTDIILCYKKMYFNGTIREQLNITTSKGNEYAFLTYNSSPFTDDSKLTDFFDIITQKNPDVLTENTKKNIQILNAKYNLKLKK